VLFLLVSPLFHISSRISVENLIVYAENAMMKKGLDSGDTEKDTPYSVPASVDAGQGMVTAEQNPILDKEIADDYETLSSVVVDADISVYSLIENYWKYVRCGVAIGISIYILLSNIFFYVSCRRNRIPYKRDEETKLNIFLLEGIGSPFLMGKDVYIDAKMTADAKRLRHMIIHEYCHYRHCDNLWVMVRNICFVLNWYNPFMWIAMDFMKRDCELACDEDVLAILDDNERKAYGYTLLEIAKHQNLQNRHFTVTTTMNGNIKKLKERITVISSEGKNNFGIVCAVAVCTMLLIVFTFTHKEESIRGSNETKETISMNVSETAEDEIEDADSLSSTNASLNNVGWNNNTSNIIYNSVKCYNNYFYYSDSEGFKRIDKGLAKIDTLAEGNVKF
jgi:hypothetical protein